LIKWILLLTLISLFLPASALAADAETGTIEGRIINKTEGGSSVAGLDMTLQTYQGETEIGSATAKTDGEGHFIFNVLLTAPGNNYQITIAFQGAEYNSERLSFTEGEAAKSTEIIVFDSTTSDEAIKIVMAHTIIYSGQGSLEVKDYLLFANEADRTYIGSDKGTTEGERETLKFALPRGAMNLQVTMGLLECCITGTEDGFSCSMPILPGSSEVAYSYTINNDSGTYAFSQKVNYPIIRYDLLLQGEDIKVKDTQLVEEEPMDINGTLFKHLSGVDLTPGDIITAQFFNLPGTRRQGIIAWVIIGAFVAGIGLAVVYMMRRGKPQPGSSEPRANQEQARLLIELAGLDDDFDDGKIAEDDYRKLRAEKKAQIAALMQREKEENGGG